VSRRGSPRCCCMSTWTQSEHHSLCTSSAEPLQATHQGVSHVALVLHLGLEMGVIGAVPGAAVHQSGPKVSVGAVPLQHVTHLGGGVTCGLVPHLGSELWATGAFPGYCCASVV
jgi:hypothetical protein